MAAGFAVGAAARDGRHRTAPATDVQVLNIYNWADYVASPDFAIQAPLGRET
jgi:hypothetical protein